MRRSYLWAGLVLAVIAGWLASGYIVPSAAPTPEEEAVENAGSADDKLFRVSTLALETRERVTELTLPGQTEGDQRVEIRARTAGIVEEVPREEGERVAAGDVLCQLDIADREAALAQARAQLASAKRDFEAAEKLAANNYTSQSQLASARAAYDAAQAEVDRIQREINYTTVTSPIAGVVEERPADLGSFLQVGQACATVIALDPIVVHAQVSERDVGALEVGMDGRAELVDGGTVKGRVSYIAPRADMATRTFGVELKAANPQGHIRAGVTAELIIPLEPQAGHRIPSSALTLDESGRTGVMTVDASDVAHFVPVKVMAETREGLWVSGLPDRVTIITDGKDFVTDGQRVAPVPAGSGTTGPSDGIAEAN